MVGQAVSQAVSQVDSRGGGASDGRLLPPLVEGLPVRGEGGSAAPERNALVVAVVVAASALTKTKGTMSRDTTPVIPGKDMCNFQEGEA